MFDIFSPAKHCWNCCHSHSHHVLRHLPVMQPYNHQPSAAMESLTADHFYWSSNKQVTPAARWLIPMASSSLAELLLLPAMFSDAVVIGLVNRNAHGARVPQLCGNLWALLQCLKMPPNTFDHYDSNDAEDDVAMSKAVLHIRLVHRDSPPQLSSWSMAAAVVGGNKTLWRRQVCGDGGFRCADKCGVIAKQDRGGRAGRQFPAGTGHGQWPAMASLYYIIWGSKIKYY